MLFKISMGMAMLVPTSKPMVEFESDKIADTEKAPYKHELHT